METQIFVKQTVRLSKSDNHRCDLKPIVLIVATIESIVKRSLSTVPWMKFTDLVKPLGLKTTAGASLRFRPLEAQVAHRLDFDSMHLPSRSNSVESTPVKLDNLFYLFNRQEAQCNLPRDKIFRS
jgi:hypothetical protein